MNKRGAVFLLKELIYGVLGVILVALVFYGMYLGASQLFGKDDASIQNFYSLAQKIEEMANDQSDFKRVRNFPYYISNDYILIGYDSDWDNNKETGLVEVNGHGYPAMMPKPEECTEDRACLVLWEGENVKSYYILQQNLYISGADGYLEFSEGSGENYNDDGAIDGMPKTSIYQLFDLDMDFSDLMKLIFDRDNLEIRDIVPPLSYEYFNINGNNEDAGCQEPNDNETPYDCQERINKFGSRSLYLEKYFQDGKIHILVAPLEGSILIRRTAIDNIIGEELHESGIGYDGIGAELANFCSGSSPLPSEERQNKIKANAWYPSDKTYEELAIQSASLYGVDPALLATHMVLESNIGESNSCTNEGKSALTGCNWPPSCASSCGCDNPDVLSDQTQLSCTSRVDKIAYAEATTRESHGIGAYTKCADSTYSTEEKWNCIFCVYQGDYDQIISGSGSTTYFTQDKTCKYAEDFKNIYCKWRNYFEINYPNIYLPSFFEHSSTEIADVAEWATTTQALEEFQQYVVNNFECSDQIEFCLTACNYFVNFVLTELDILEEGESCGASGYNVFLKDRPGWEEINFDKSLVKRGDVLVRTQQNENGHGHVVIAITGGHVPEPKVAEASLGGSGPRISEMGENFQKIMRYQQEIFQEQNQNYEIYVEVFETSVIGKLYLIQQNEILKEYSISVGRNGIGKTQEGDEKTPLGEYEIIWKASADTTEIENYGGHIIEEGAAFCGPNSLFTTNPEIGYSSESLWTTGYGGPNSVVFGINYPNEGDITDGYSGGCIEIHASPNPTEGSAGCIRIANSDAHELYSYINEGTKVTISEQNIFENFGNV